jgi:hypothetical protein
MKRWLFTILSLAPLASLAQDLTGTWEALTPTASTDYARICVVRNGNSYVGYTYDTKAGFCKCHFTAEYSPNTKKLKGVNTGVIEKTSNHSQCRYNLTYIVIDGKEYLNGTIDSKSTVLNILTLGMVPPSYISYTRTSNKTDTTAYMQDWLMKNLPKEPPAEVTKQDTTTPSVIIPVIAADTTPVVIPNPAPVAVADKIITEKNKRTTDTLSVISTDAMELVIKVMDNGVVDGDTVSIIHNGRVIAERISVKATPHEIKIPIGKGNERQEIVLVAHNLGSIAPNTALIIIETRDKQHRLTASTDLSKNAMIIFQYKE